MEITTQCQHCGGPVNINPDVDEFGEAIQWPDGDGDFFRQILLKKVAPIVVHDACANAILARQRQASESEKARLRLEQWGTVCPPAFQITEIDRLQNPALMRAILELELDKGIGVLFVGPTDKCKTRMAFLLLKKLFESGAVCVALTHYEFIATSSNMRRYELQARRDGWLKLIQECDWLMIDDLGKESFTNSDGESTKDNNDLWGCLTKRWDNMRPCIITTQFKASALLPRLSGDMGPALVRRMKQFHYLINDGIYPPQSQQK